MTTNKMTEDELRAVLDAYERERTEALERRDAGLRRARDSGWRPVDIERFAGMSRETVRQALNPEAREAARQALADRRAAKKGEGPA